MNSTTVRKTQKWIYTNMVWLLIVLSILFFLFAWSDIFIDSISSILEKIGFSIFSSGVFAGVLKSIQFTGIFKSVIEEIMLGTDFIENRSQDNQKELWKATSKAIYKKKFPELSDFIENRILESYLPTEKNHYKRNFVATIDISKIDENMNIFYVQTLKYDVVLDENIDEIELTSRINIFEEEVGEEYKDEILKFKVNGKEADSEKSKDDNNRYELTKTKLKSENGNKVFKIERKTERMYSLRKENYKLIRMSTFTFGVDVLISFPENVNVSFFNIGNVRFFEEEHSGIKNQICRSHKNDVILPYQGFGMSFELINENKS